MAGMTIRQYYLHRFYQLIEAKRNLDMTTAEGRNAFVAISIQIHIAKGYVHKRLWPLVNK